MTLRDDIVSNALWGVANEKQIHYRQSRPMDGIGDPRKLPLTTDCSGFATVCYQWAGAPDPNGNDYNGQGYTGTLLAHLEHIDRGDLLPGDLVVFGPGGGDHVVVAVESGPNPMCVSHGQERGPIAIRLDTEAAAHRPPVTFLRGIGEVSTASTGTATPVTLDNPEEPDMALDADDKKFIDSTVGKLVHKDGFGDDLQGLAAAAAQGEIAKLWTDPEYIAAMVKAYPGLKG